MTPCTTTHYFVSSDNSRRVQDYPRPIGIWCRVREVIREARDRLDGAGSTLDFHVMRRVGDV